MVLLHAHGGDIMPRSKASNEAQYRYNKEHLKRIPLDVQLSEYELIKASAEASGMSVNGFIKQAIRQAMDQATTPPSGDPGPGRGGLNESPE